MHTATTQRRISQSSIGTRRLRPAHPPVGSCVNPRLTAGEQRYARRQGKTDRLDAEAVARVVAREADRLPVLVLEDELAFLELLVREPTCIKAAQVELHDSEIRKARAGAVIKGPSKIGQLRQHTSWPDARAPVPYAIRTKRESFASAERTKRQWACCHVLGSGSRRRDRRRPLWFGAGPPSPGRDQDVCSRNSRR